MITIGKKQKKIIRSFAVPFIFTAGVIVFWLEFHTDKFIWWPILILLIFIFNYAMLKAKKVYQK
jgi:hypothetical protein